MILLCVLDLGYDLDLHNPSAGNRDARKRPACTVRMIQYIGAGIVRSVIMHIDGLDFLGGIHGNVHRKIVLFRSRIALGDQPANLIVCDIITGDDLIVSKRRLPVNRILCSFLFFFKLRGRKRIDVDAFPSGCPQVKFLCRSDQARFPCKRILDIAACRHMKDAVRMEIHLVKIADFLPLCSDRKGINHISGIRPRIYRDSQRVHQAAVSRILRREAHRSTVLLNSDDFRCAQPRLLRGGKNILNLVNKGIGNGRRSLVFQLVIPLQIIVASRFDQIGDSRFNRIFKTVPHIHRFRPRCAGSTEKRSLFPDLLFLLLFDWNPVLVEFLFPLFLL